MADKLKYDMGIPQSIKKAINDDPVLLSLLYDVNMLPEEINSAEQERCLKLVVVAYRLGKATAE